MTRQILDPAERLTPEFLAALRGRYVSDLRALPTPDTDDFDERYGDLCDLVIQLLWPETYGVDPGDPLRHTSAPARAIASLIMDVAGIAPPSGKQVK